MLSTERSIGHSNSSRNQIEVVESDEKNSQKICSHKPDTIDFDASPSTPNFSIRDHVYKSRSNGIGACWPFKPKFLQLCLTNGVKELLPPFEAAHLMKNHSISITSQPPDPSITDVIHERRELNPDENINGTDNLQSVVIKNKKMRNKSVIKAKNASELLEKKCKLVIKLSCSVRGASREELASNNNAAIDQMSSKICPVCKTFSSSSNTTLNAHIDQCLSMGYCTKRFGVDVLKPRTKPRKKKLIVDIYATALQYTLEDLDRRNGTNWTASAVAADPSAIPAEPMKPNLKEPGNPSKMVVEPKGKDKEGAAFVDSNGIKTCILSKLSNAPTCSSVVSREDKKKGKVQFAKRKVVGANIMERKNLNLDTKKHKKFKILKTQVQQLTTDRDGSKTANENEMNPCLHRLLEKPRDSIISCPAASSLGNWVRAKRSDIHKKRKNKNPYDITQRFASIIENSPSTSSQIWKHSNSNSTNSTVRLKLPKPLLESGGNSGKPLSENVSTNKNFCNSPLPEPQNNLFGSRKFQKQRSMLRFGKRRGRVSQSFQVFYGSTEVLAEETFLENKRLKFTQNNELHEEFAPEQEQFRESTKIQSPAVDTELDVEVTASKGHLDEYIGTSNDDPIHVEGASCFQEANAIARIEEDCDDDGNAVETSDVTDLDTTQDDLSVTSNCEDEVKLSGSPSTASRTSLSTLNKSTNKQLGLFTQPSSPDVAESPQGVDKIKDNSCLCSWESIPEEFKKAATITKERQLPPLYIGPRETGAFNAYRSFPRPDPMVNSGFESPNQSYSTLSQSSVPPSPNPVLRLMGKNLLVVNHEEIAAQPPTPSSHSPSTFGPLNCSANQNVLYQNFCSVVSQPPPTANQYQAFPVSNSQMLVSPSPFVSNEVIVIDNSPKIDNVDVPIPMQLLGANMGKPVPHNISILDASMMQHSPFFCFPQHNQAVPTGSVFYPRVMHAGYITQQVGSFSNELGSFIPSSFTLQSPSDHVGNPLYYSHTLR